MVKHLSWLRRREKKADKGSAQKRFLRIFIWQAIVRGLSVSTERPIFFRDTLTRLEINAVLVK
jgi:hypothetical protein